jgi:hypothetical protein
VSTASVRDTSATTSQTKALDATGQIVGQIVGQAVGQVVGQVVGRGREMSVNVISVDRQIQHNAAFVVPLRPRCVISGHSAVQSPCLLYPQKRTCAVQ